MSISIEQSGSKVNIVFSPSSFDLFETCCCKYNYSHNLRKTLPMIQRPESLDRGTLIHIGLETYFNALAAGEGFNDRMQKTLMKIRETASDTNLSNIDLSEELPIILSAVEQSCDYWRAEDENLEILAVEAPFDFVLFEDDYVRIILSGKVDLLVNVHGIGQQASYNNLPIDHKSTKRESLISRKNNQFKCYSAVTQSNYLWVNQIGLQKTLPAEKKFKRIPLSYDPLMIAEWKQNVINVILGRYLQCVKTGIWPMNETSCTKFNRLCEFDEICDTSGEDNKIYKLNQLFVDKEAWDKYEEKD